jgi:hypothetical protein
MDGRSELGKSTKQIKSRPRSNLILEFFQYLRYYLPALDILRIAGIKKAKVFPDPVMAIPITSRPDRRGGQHWA